MNMSESRNMKDRSFQMMSTNTIENSTSLELELGCCLPYDIMINILIRLPVKTLIRFKCVSKNWQKLMGSSLFIDQHLSHSSSNSFLLLQETPSSSRLIGSDFKVYNPLHMDFNGEIIGCSNGLLCVRNIFTDKLVICNPATRQVKEVPFLTLIKGNHEYEFGFGFSHLVNDYKIVRISQCYGNDYCLTDDDDDDDDVDYYGYDEHDGLLRVYCAEVYSLTTRSWKEINVDNLQNFVTTSSSVTANGAMFWQVEMVSDPDERFMISFDIAHEVFTLLRGPPRSESLLFIDDVPTVHNDKLAMFRRFYMEDDMRDSNSNSCCFDVWVLEDTCAVGEANWIKKYSVGPFLTLLNLHPSCFWRDGIVSYCGWENSPSSLSIFNLYSYELKELHVPEECYDALINYAESLVLVDNIQ